MCHYETPAPTLPDSIAFDEQVTDDDPAVPYLTCTARDGGRSVGERPWIVIATDIFGVTPFYRHLAGLLAGAGYRVAVPDLFHRVGPARDAGRDAALERRRLLDDRQALRDLDGVVAAVRGTGPSFGVLGFCLGGTLALLSAAWHPDQATITYYAFPHAAPGAAVAAEWPVTVAADIRGPVLGFWGRQDYISPDEVAELGAALGRGAAEHEIVWYDDAGHGFLAGLARDGTDSPAAHRSWQRTQGFFARHLAPTVVS